MPRAYYERVREDRSAFQFERAWIDKTKRIKEARGRTDQHHAGGARTRTGVPYRDDVRDFWLRRAGNAAGFSLRVAGSPDVFEGRGPQSSVNYVTSHDGFTLRDLVSYEKTHNQENGEENHDGMRANRSWNGGIEGESDDPWIRALRGRERRNLITTLLVSQGIPMLLASDELGRTQRGNDNAYCQDNETSWLDWGRVDHTLADFVGTLCRLQTEHPSLRRMHWLAGAYARTRPDGVRYFDALANEMREGEPALVRGVMQMLIPGRNPSVSEHRPEWVDDADFLLLLNPRDFDTLFCFPTDERVPRSWWRVIDTGSAAHVGTPLQRVSGVVTCRAHSMVVLMGGETR
jgi:glycogen operon protein